MNLMGRGFKPFICKKPPTVMDGPLSGKRGSNPRPSAWEADALPTELLPRWVCMCKDTYFVFKSNCCFDNFNF